MNRNTVGLIWIGGLLLAVLLTVVEPGSVGAAFDRSLDAVAQVLQRFGDPARETIRGFAIAAYVVFVALCVLARRRGLPSMTAAIVVTLLFVLLVGGPRNWGVSLRSAHWLSALLVNLVAAALMSRRLSVPGIVRRS